MVEVQYMRETKRFKPEEISSMVLMKMKQTAEDFLGHPVKNAVVTGMAVPFSARMRVCVCVCVCVCVLH